MRPAIVISGYYGFGNAGDEAVLDGILATLAEIGLDEKVTVLSGNPALTSTYHQGVKAVHRYHPIAALRAIRRADLVISGGGSLLQDVTSTRSLQYYLFILALAQKMHRKTMVYAQGIGPLNFRKSRQAVARVLGKANAVTVRDQDSVELLRSIDVSGAQLVADPSFLAPADLDAADTTLADHGLSAKPLLGVSVRPWAGNRWLPTLTSTVRELCDSLGLQPVLIPMQPGEDVSLCAETELGPVIGSGLPPRTVKGIVARCSMVIGMRLHSLMFATDAGVPFVALAYDPKVWAFVKETGCCEALDAASTSTDDLRRAALDTWENREALRHSLLERAQSFRRSALIAGDIARQLASPREP